MRSDTWRPWTWAVFAFTTLFGVIFAILCWFSYTNLRHMADDVDLLTPPGTTREWVDIFNGAAASAFFAVVLVVLFLLLATYYMILSVRPLGHPRSKYGKGVLVGAAFFIALHLCNIAAQFYTFHGASTFLAYNRQLLTATWVFGFISTLCFLIFTCMLAFWHDKAAENLELQALSRSDLYGVEVH
eukprot:jgi/Botrbrau1/18237/Bobra.53_1s0091.1